MKIAICDDEDIFREQLKNDLEAYYRSLDVLIHSVSSGEALLEASEKNKYDLIFLDIEMQGMDGLEAAKCLQQSGTKAKIIFLTSHTELAMEGYEVEAFRFLGKPVEQQKLYAALKAFEACVSKEIRIAITENGMQYYLPCDEICYLESQNVYLRIVMQKEEHLIRRKLKDMAKELPQELFVTIHRSYIVNLKYIKSFQGNQVMLTDGTILPVSKGNKELFTEQMMKYMRGKG